MGKDTMLREKFSTSIDRELIKKLKFVAVEKELKLNELLEIAIEFYLKSLKIRDKK